MFCLLSDMQKLLSSCSENHGDTWHDSRSDVCFLLTAFWNMRGRRRFSSRLSS